MRIFDLQGDEHFVGLETLTHVLHGVQRAIFVLVRDVLRLPSSKTLPAKIKKAFAIRCSVPKSGSYVIPLEFGESELSDLPPETSRYVADRLYEHLKALNIRQM